MTNTTWSTTDKTAGVTLSGSNLVATVSTSSQGVRAGDGQFTGKYYFEITLTTTGSAQTISGVANLNAALTGVATTATSTNACGVIANTGNVVLNGAASGISFGVRATGDIIGIAIDLDNNLAWFRIAPSGNWNNNASFAPGGTGGVSLALIHNSVTSLRPLWGAAASSAVTANFGGTAFSGTVPVGYTSGWPTSAFADSGVVTEVALDEWGAGNPVSQVSKIALDEWGAGNPVAQVSKVAIDEWSASTGTLLGLVSSVFIDEWGSVSLPANVTLTGVVTTSSVGTSTVELDGSFTLTGVAGTTAVGTPVPEIDHAVTGVATTSALGSLTVEGDASFTLTGLSTTSAVGDPTLEIDDAALTGQVATAAVGTSTIEIDTSVTGVASTSAVGDPTTDVFFPVFVTGVVATPLVGLLLGTAVPIIGVEADSAIGTPGVAIIDGAIIDGVASTVTLGTLALQEDNNPSIVGVQTNLGMGTIHAVVEPVVTGVAATSALGVPIPTNLQLASFSLQIGLGIIATTVDNAVVVGVQSRAQAGVPLAISTGNRISVAVTGLTATPAIGALISQIGIAVTGVEADFAIADVTVGIAVTSALTMTDIQIEAILDLRDDFSVTLRWSDTDGYSWSDSAIRSIGQTGNYLCNPQWRRLGMSRRGRVFEISWSCPQATSLQGATVMLEDASR